MWLTCTNKSYDFAYTREAHGVKGRFHHITYALDSREDILRAADIFLENGVFIETGPHKTRCSRPSSSTSMSLAATASRSPTPARGSGGRGTGSRWSGPRRSAKRAGRGA